MQFVLPFFPPDKSCRKCSRKYPEVKFHLTDARRCRYKTICHECDSERRKAQYRANHEHELEGAARRRAENPERVKKHYEKRRADLRKKMEDREVVRRYYQAHKSEHRERAKKWEKANPVKVRARRRRKVARYRAANPEKCKARMAAYRKNNAEKVNEINRRGYYRRRCSGGGYTAEEWSILCAAFGDCCAACGQKRKLTVDHVIPITQGGNSNIENLQPLCGPCNSKKHAKAVDYRPRWLVELLQRVDE